MTEEPHRLPKDETARVKALLRFIVPAFGTVMSEPLLSLVDALCIGQASTSLDLAALGPPLVIFFFMFYIIMMFLGSTVTIMVTSALTKKNAKVAEQVLSCGLRLAIIFGCLIMTPLVVMPKTLMLMTGAETDLIEVATSYTRIRACSLPFAFVSIVLQAGLLAQTDVITPMLATFGSALVNISGDIILVCWFKLGLYGAACATVAGSGTATLLMIIFGYTVRPGLKLRIWMPLKTEFWMEFMQIGSKLLGFGAFTLFAFVCLNTVATWLDVAACAAHQAMYQPWSLAGTVSFPLQQAAQVFLQAELPDGSSTPRTNDLVEASSLIRCLMRMAFSCGLASGCICLALSTQPWLLTVNQDVWPNLRSIGPCVFGALIFQVPAMTLDGILMTIGEAGFLMKCQFANLALMTVGLSVTHFAGWGVTGLWLTLCLWFLARTLESSAHLHAWLRRSRPRSLAHSVLRHTSPNESLSPLKKTTAVKVRNGSLSFPEV